MRKTHAKVSCIFFRGREEVTATDEELNLSILDGLIMRYYLNTVKIEKDGIIVEPVVKQTAENGDVSYINASENAYKIPATSIIIAIGQGPQSNIVSSSKDIDTNKRGLIQTTTNGETTREGVFAGGDVVYGAKTVVEAVAVSKMVAKEIEEYCYNKKAKSSN